MEFLLHIVSILSIHTLAYGFSFPTTASELLSTQDGLKLPFICVLRGVKHSAVEAVADVLRASHFSAVSVTVDTENYEECIRTLARKGIVVGASTISTQLQVKCAALAGAQFISSTCLNSEIIRETKKLGMLSMPGIKTPEDALRALSLGADFLKVYPYDKLQLAGLQKICKVVPPDSRGLVIAAGGVLPSNIPHIFDTGASGCALGSTVYRAGDNLLSLAEHSRNFEEAYRTYFTKNMHKEAVG